MKDLYLEPCSECGKVPHIENLSTHQFNIGWMIECQNGCYEKYEPYSEVVGIWFQTFPWKDIKDAASEWNTAVSHNNGIRKEIRDKVNAEV